MNNFENENEVPGVASRSGGSYYSAFDDTLSTAAIDGSVTSPGGNRNENNNIINKSASRDESTSGKIGSLFNLSGRKRPIAVPSSPSSSLKYGPSDELQEYDNDDEEDRNNSAVVTVTGTDASVHRGFSTSIHDMFLHPEHERVDCCAMTCFGMMQSDRDRFILQGIRPPGLLRRTMSHLVLPFLLFLGACMGAMHIRDPLYNQVYCYVMILFLIYYLCEGCAKGSLKRRGIRRDLLWTKYKIANSSDLQSALNEPRPDQQGYHRDSEELPEYYMGQTRDDINGAHPCCIVSCYNEDRTPEQEEDRIQRGNSYTNPCHSLWMACYRPFSGCHVQFCGICGLAQEGRDLETVILPAAYRRIDYITMQPITEYYPAIYNAKQLESVTDDEGNTSKASSRWSAPRLSRLSFRILQTFGVVTAALLAYSFLGKIYWRFVMGIRGFHTFDITDFGVYLLIWGQSIGFLMVLVWLTNRHVKTKVSTDAMIKFFAAGFALSTFLSVFWETVLGLITRVILYIIMLACGIRQVEGDDYEYGSTNWIGGDMSSFLAMSGGSRSLLGNIGEDSSMSGRDLQQENLSLSYSFRKSFWLSFGVDHPILYTVYLLFACIFLAALVEELSKYFGYRMVEHPDFLTQEQLEEAFTIGGQSPVAVKDTTVSVLTRRRQGTKRARAEGKVQNFSNHNKSKEARGAAITQVMIAVAMGFTCCENIIYIFSFGRKFGPQTELFILLVRSLFPIHPLSMAIQSIGVCKRDIEQERAQPQPPQRRTNLGGIVKEAVLFHGMYDFFVLWIDFMAKRHGVFYAGEDVNLIRKIAIAASMSVSACIMGSALLYYYIQAKRQRERLAKMDNEYIAPAGLLENSQFT